MKRIKIARIIFISAFTFWIIETVYFGLNWKAVTDAEKICDSIVAFAYVIAFLNYIRPLHDEYMRYLKSKEK